MGKIILPPADHNPGRPIRRGDRFLWPYLLVMIWLAAGCGNAGQGESAGQAESAGRAGARNGKRPADCPVIVDDVPWTTFRALADRMAAGQEVPRPELEAYAELPSVAAWCLTQGPPPPRPAALANWLEGAWWDEMQRQGNRKQTASGNAMGLGFRYCQAEGQRIDGLVAEFTAGPRACEVHDLARQWLSPDHLPARLTLSFQPVMPELRMADGMVFVDTGVLAAGGADQTVRQIVSLLYRNLEATPGPNPIEVQGAAAVIASLRVMKNEGVAGWIEQTTNVVFDRSHPSLHKVAFIPEEFYRKAQQTIGNLSSWLPEMLADPAVMESKGQAFARYLAANNGFSQTGLAMADVIAVRLGPEKLQAVRNSLADFLAAYQEASLPNGTSVPDPGAPGIKLPDSVPALDPELHAQLQALIAAHE